MTDNEKKAGNSEYHKLTAFQKTYIKIKDGADIILAAIGTAVLSPVFLGITLAIKLEDGWSAPVFFSQKRVGKDKKYFKLYKFRSMKLDTPHDTPTHMLEHPEQYITKVGKFLRKTSLDELPQLINIVKGEMNVVNSRPALWNQYDLIAERDKYGVHQMKPGLTGWAQIHGRDELEIEEKAKLDGYYLKHVGPVIDIKCFFGTIISVLKSDGVVEGGTGAMKETTKKAGDSKEKEVSNLENTVKSHTEKTKTAGKKILLITNHSYMLWRFRRELIAELMKAHEVVISMPFVGHEDDFQKMGVRCIKTDLDRRGINPVTDVKLLHTYYKILKQEKPDKVITYSIKPNIYAGLVCSLMHIPYYANVQGLGTAFQKKGLAQFVTALYKLAFLHVQAVFFENKVNAQEFVKRHIISSRKVKILAGAGINLEDYKQQPYPENDKIHFLYLGRIMKEKGIDELFAAVRKLNQEGEDFVLDLVGFFEDEYKEQVEELQKKGIVVFHGFQEEPRPFYAAADCIVLPSYHEGMSNVLLEAAATGRPVITSNIPGCREAVKHGQNGFLVKVKDKKSLYEAMKQFLELSNAMREAMGKAGRRKMEQEFDKKKVVEETMKAIQQVI